MRVLFKIIAFEHGYPDSMDICENRLQFRWSSGACELDIVKEAEDSYRIYVNGREACAGPCAFPVKFFPWRRISGLRLDMDDELLKFVGNNAACWATFRVCHVSYAAYACPEAFGFGCCH